MNTTYDEILTTGLRLWREKMQKPSVRSVAKAMGVTHPAVLYYVKSTDGLHKKLAEHAVTIGDITIVPLLLVTDNPAVGHFTDDQRRTYLSN